MEIKGNTLQCVEFLERQKIDLKWEVKEYREKRSLSANAYFYVLIEKIAKERTKITGAAVSKEDVHKEMIIKYGTWDRNKDGSPKWVVYPKEKPLPDGYFYDTNADVEIKSIKNGVEKITPGHAYIVVKGSHSYNKKEMSELLNGVISEAQELEIETRTPAEIEQMIKEMEK